MYFNEDGFGFYDPNFTYEQANRDLPLECPYRQRVPSPSFPQMHQGMPHSGPPNFTPPNPQSQQLGVTPLAVDQGAIRPCLFRFVYIWPRRGRGFWSWITFVGPRSVAGFRWDFNSWRYFGMDLRDISSFQCF